MAWPGFREKGGTSPPGPLCVKSLRRAKKGVNKFFTHLCILSDHATDPPPPTPKLSTVLRKVPARKGDPVLTTFRDRQNASGAVLFLCVWGGEGQPRVL